jgi:hypothetical protein
MVKLDESLDCSLQIGVVALAVLYQALEFVGTSSVGWLNVLEQKLECLNVRDSLRHVIKDVPSLVMTTLLELLLDHCVKGIDFHPWSTEGRWEGTLKAFKSKGR